MAAPNLLRQRVVAALSHGSPFSDLLPVLSPPLARADPEVLASIPTGFVHGFRPPSVPNFGCTSYSQMLPPSSNKTGFKFSSLRSELLIASGATTAGMYLWSKAGKEAGDNDLIKVNDGDVQKPSSNPPQQGGNGSGGLGDNEKWVFVKLLTDLQKQVNRLLEGKEYAQGLRSDLEKK